MRITNQMMINSSISNIQVNKNQMNTLSTELSTQKKISKPSDDPIIAIRALRLRSSLDEVTQYLGKNIPDASSWLSVTHDALDESNSIIKDLYRYCVQGSTDSYSESERNTLAESLNKLVEAYYEQGNMYLRDMRLTDRLHISQMQMLRMLIIQLPRILQGKIFLQRQHILMPTVMMIY